MLNKTALLSLLLSLYSFDAHAAEDLDLPPANEIREVCEYIGGLKSFSHGIGRGFLDINNDQKLEKISFITSGTMNIPIPQYEDMQGDEVRVNSINFE